MTLPRFAICAAACALAAASAYAQVARIQPGATAPRTGNAQQAATFGLPRAGGLNSQFPAGLTTGSGPATGAAATTLSAGSPATTTAAATSPTAGPVVIENPNATITGAIATATPAGTTPIVVGAGVPAAGGADPNAAAATYAATAVMGAGSNIPAARQGGSFGPGPYTAVEVAQSFLNADANGDRELTRAEATRLSLMPFSFEEMDRNHDGVVSRGEYDESLR